MKNVLRKIIVPGVMILAVLFSGYVIGRLIGIQIIKGVLKGSKAVLLFYKPPFEFIYTSNLLSSYDELKRLEGYYSLLDNRIIDADSLIERYEAETDFIKPTIIWLLGYSGDIDIVLQFLSQEYNKIGKKNVADSKIGTDQRIKREILKSMMKLDKNFFENFIKTHKIK